MGESGSLKTGSVDLTMFTWQFAEKFSKIGSYFCSHYSVSFRFGDSFSTIFVLETNWISSSADSFLLYFFSGLV